MKATIIRDDADPQSEPIVCAVRVDHQGYASLELDMTGNPFGTGCPCPDCKDELNWMPLDAVLGLEAVREVRFR